MNEIEDRLAAAVRAEARFGPEAVAGRVAERRRRRLMATSVAALVVIVGLGVGLAALSGDDEGNLDVTGNEDRDDGGDGDGTDPGPDPIDDSQPPEVVLEDPVGADGTAGATSTAHLIADSPFPECASLGSPGPATGDEFARQEALWQAFSDDFISSEWPFVSGFGSPENTSGRPSVFLTRPDADTFERLLDYYDPDSLCVGLPPAAEVPPVPVDIPWVLVGTPAAGDTVVRVVEDVDCAVKATRVDPWVHETDDRIEIGVQAWSEPGSAFNDDCPAPTEYVIELAEPVGDRVVAPAGARPLTVEDPVEAGGTAAFSIATGNLAGLETTGDDLFARRVDDPSVRFQVSDVFGDRPVAGAPRAVALDQWPVTGAGTIAVPADVPAGTYTIQFLDHPHLNGTLEVSEGASAGDDDAADDGGEAAAPAAGVLMADGRLSDIHVEATDIPLPECTEDDLFGDFATDEDLVALRDALTVEGLTDQPFLSTTSVGDVIQIGLNRRYGPTIDWIAERVEPADVCLLFYPPVGLFAAPAPTLDWVVAASADDSADVTLRLDRDCGLLGSEPLEPVIQEAPDLVLVHWASSAFAGPTSLPCLSPDEATFTLDSPLGGRPILVAGDPGPVVMAPGEEVGIDVGHIASASTDGLGDDVMIRSVDDPTRQIQVTGVWAEPTAGPPAPIVTDRYAPADRARVVVPAGTPPGDYTWVFIEHPQLSGTLTVTS